MPPRSIHSHFNIHDYSSPAELQTFEPALTQLQHLRPPDLDRLLRSWLIRCGFQQLRRCPSQEPAVTYQVLAQCLPLDFSVRFRIHQRHSRLQAHHVEAFAGHLLRAGVSLGALITTGEFTAEARRIAASYPSLHLRLYSGREFAEELSARRIGMRQISLWHWVLDLTRKLRRRPRKEEL